MKNYAEMSDFELNVEVARKVGSSLVQVDSTNNPLTASVHLVLGGECHQFDPCNSWADAGPIIESNKIKIEYRHDCNDFWLAATSTGGKAFLQKNPLRAAMIVFLMMHENDKP